MRSQVPVDQETHVHEIDMSKEADKYYEYIISRNRDDTFRMAVICLENVLLATVFGLIAHSFDKWWIILFSLLCMSTYKSEN